MIEKPKSPWRMPLVPPPRAVGQEIGQALLREKLPLWVPSVQFQDAGPAAELAEHAGTRSGFGSRHQRASHASFWASLIARVLVERAAGPPGAACISRKLTMAIRKMTGTACRARLIMYLPTGHLFRCLPPLGFRLPESPARLARVGASRRPRVCPTTYRKRYGAAWNQSSTCQVGPAELGLYLFHPPTRTLTPVVSAR